MSLWVLEGEPALQGVIALQRFGHEGLLRSLAIAPEQRRRGFGRELVVRLEQDAHAEGVERLILLTETAEMFFRALGYQSVDRHSVGHAVTQSAEFRSLCPATALCMSKALGS
jgi:amino-acid N-acetyltransferase